jgi:hypothetical protein
VGEGVWEKEGVDNLYQFWEEVRQVFDKGLQCEIVVELVSDSQCFDGRKWAALCPQLAVVPYAVACWRPVALFAGREASSGAVVSQPAVGPATTVHRFPEAVVGPQLIVVRYAVAPQRSVARFAGREAGSGAVESWFAVGPETTVR